VERFTSPAQGFHFDSSAELLRFDNLHEAPDAEAIQVTWLPEGDQPIRVACPIDPERSRGYSLCEEPSVVRLPDDRLFLVVRTVTGRIWYTVSEDEGRSWRPPEVLRAQDGGSEMLHPKAPCPLYALADGRFVLFFHNHDGFGYGGRGPWGARTATARRSRSCLPRETKRSFLFSRSWALRCPSIIFSRATSPEPFRGMITPPFPWGSLRKK